MKDLSKIKLGYSPLSDEIYLYRHGKDDNVALDKRIASRDVMAVLIEYMMHDSPKGAIQKVSLKEGEWFQVRVKPIEPPSDDKENGNESNT